MKPKKKYIQQEVIKLIEADVRKLEEELRKKSLALVFANLSVFKLKFEDYKDTEWYVSIRFPNGVSKSLFINKKTGKNSHPKLG